MSVDTEEHKTLSADTRWPWAKVSDVELVSQYRQGRTEVFRELVLRHTEAVYREAYGILRSAEDAADVAQVTFTRAFMGLGGFRGEAQVSTWLRKIARYEALNRLRYAQRRGRNKTVSLDMLDKAAPGEAQQAASTLETPADSMITKERAAILEACVSQLSEKLQTAFRQKVFGRSSLKEMAETMNCPEGTVKSRLHEAIDRVKQCIKFKTGGII